MKLELPKILFIGILVQIFATQGILMFNVFDFFGNWELKTLLHPIGVLMCVFYFVCKGLNRNTKLRLSIIESLLIAYFILSIIPLIINTESILEFYIAFREVVLIFILILIYSKSPISHKYWRRILKLLHILIVLNITFIILTYILGPEQYMKLVSGRFIWPIDPEYKFKISNFYSFWRSPGLIGESGAVGLFGILCYFLFLEDEKYNKKKIFPLILTILSFTRSIFLALIIFIFIKFLLKKKNLKKLEIIAPYSLPFLLIISIPLYLYNLLSVKSILMRIDHWFNDVNVNYNLIYGGAFGEVGGAARGEGFVSTLDSYWLLMLTSVGFVGIILVLFFLYEKSLGFQTRKIILISFCCTCFLITISQSIPFLVLFPLIFINRSFLNNNENDIKAN